MGGPVGTSRCARCATPFDAAAAPGGVCPGCLLRLGLGTGPAETSGADASTVADPPHRREGPEPEARAGESSGAGDPRRIGPYRILRPLGEGGMGTVYLAEQEGPLHRRVAVKVIKLGMDTREVVARFEAERQILAIMSHPCVARVFEAGATDRGRPYFVMEYVDGAPLTDDCDRERLGVRARLELFLRVCGAIQHAHQKGVIHRDVKPSNVLVERRDGEATPKVIDFGVAKATDPGLPRGTLLTRRGVWLGTPAYMSPEAAGATALDVDVRTDIYALGVLLYELLCGALPFDPERLRSTTDEEVRRILREEEPPAPSRRLDALGPETAERIARERGSDPASLRRRLQGDLDWIVLRAMEKERDRRYASVSDLAGDIRRHLEHRPVSASPPRVVYRLGKAVRRHRGAVVAAAGVVLALLLGIVGTTAGLLRAREAEHAAREEARTAEAVSGFLVDLFEVSDPGEARGNTVTAREILDAGARDIRRELGEEPRVRARLLGTMGAVYRKLGLYDEAAALLRDSLAIRERETARGAMDPAELAAALRELGTLAVERGRFEPARELLERALETLRSAPGADEAAEAHILKELAVLHYRTGEHDLAEPLYRESLAIARRVLGPEDPLVAWNLNDLGNIARDREDHARAEALFRRSLEIHETAYGPDHPYVANNLNNLANSYQYRGEYARALPLRRRAQAIYEKVLGPDHRLSALGLTNQAVLHHGLGHYRRAEELYRRALEVRQRMLGPEHPDVVVSLYQLADSLREQGRLDEAGPLYRRALETADEALGPDHHRTAEILRGAAAFHRASGDPARAESLLRRALVRVEETLHPRHSRVAGTLAELADVVAGRGDAREAEELFERAIAIQRELVRGSPDAPLHRAALASSLVGLGRLLHDRPDRPDRVRALRAWREAVELLTPVVADSEAVAPRHTYAVALLQLGRTEEAWPIVDDLAATGWRHPDLRDALDRP